MPAPSAWRERAARHGVRHVWLVDDRQVTSSYHHPADHAIYVNTRGTCWYETALAYGANSYVEAVTLWFLHELGHAVHQHGPNPQRAIRFGNNDPREVQAWHFALAFRSEKAVEWQRMTDAYASWYAGYRHRRKNWPDTLQEALAAGWPARPYRGWPATPPIPANRPLWHRGRTTASRRSVITLTPIAMPQ